jgi:hypothetical protein
MHRQVPGVLHSWWKDVLSLDLLRSPTVSQLGPASRRRIRLPALRPIESISPYNNDDQQHRDATVG